MKKIFALFSIALSTCAGAQYAYQQFLARGGQASFEQQNGQNYYMDPNGNYYYVYPNGTVQPIQRGW